MYLDKLKKVCKTLALSFGNLNRRVNGEEFAQGKIPRDWSQERILSYLLQKYNTNKEYTALFLDYMLHNHKDNPQFDLYVDAELGSLTRSRELIESLCKYFRNSHFFSGKDCLDIGSSAGNSLIAFIESGAARATGIEISSQRYETALVNIKGCPQEVHAKIQMCRDDIQNAEITRLGQFDAIFCSDVLEHVPDPRQAIRQICALLKNTSEAFAYIKLRNFQHPQNVLHEPHYDFPGMVLLPYDKAKKYYDLHRSDPNLEYEVCHWMSFAEYRALFHSFGKCCRYLGEIKSDLPSVNSIAEVGKGIFETFDQFSRSHHLDSVLDLEIREQITVYLNKMKCQLQNCKTSTNKQLLEEFFLDYGIFDIIMLISNS